MAKSVTARIWSLTGILAVGAVVLYPLSAHGLERTSPEITLPIVGFVVAFAVTERLVIHMHLRRDAHSLSLSELPLLVGYAFLPLPDLLLARLLGAALTLLLLRRQRLTKLSFNLTLFALETVLGALIFHAVLAGSAPIGVRLWIAAATATVATDVVGSIAISLAIAATEGRIQHEALREVISIGTFIALANAAVGVLIVTVLWTSRTAIAPLTVVAVFMYLVYQAYLSLRQRHASLQMLYRFTSATARSGETRQAAAAMLDEVCQLLRCDIAEFALLRPNEEVALRVRKRGDELLLGEDLPALTDADLAWVRKASGGKVQLHPASADASELQQFMKGQPVKDGVIAPVILNLAEELHGIVLACNRLGEVSTFDDEDAEIFKALASHAGVALENGRLVERLREEATEKAYQANHDILTGLPNRKLLQERLQAAARECDESGAAVGVLLLDLDRFKEVNDTLGHASGDVLLQEVALRLTAALRPDDTVARLGGDEFAVLVRNATQTGAMAVAERIRLELSRPFALDGVAIDVRASVGVALSTHDGLDPEALLKHADVAMYAAKSQGGGARLHTSELDVHTHRRLALAAALRTAIDEGDIQVHYQPKVVLATGEIIGAEALARWTHAELGRVGPDEFIPLAEESGMINELTVHVLQRALDDTASWHAAGHHVSVAVNISARTVVDPGFPRHLRKLLDDTGYPGEMLTLEVTESSMLTDRAQAVSNLDALSAMGLKLSIDDFGTGFSSMAYLKRLPLDELKVDQGFVRTMMDDENDAVIVRSILDLAHNLGMTTVAEGVEDEQTCLALQALGCESAQGYLWSPPVGTGALLELLEGKDWSGNLSPVPSMAP